jgi:hypothetical protein
MKIIIIVKLVVGSIINSNQYSKKIPFFFSPFIFLDHSGKIIPNMKLLNIEDEFENKNEFDFFNINLCNYDSSIMIVDVKLSYNFVLLRISNTCTIIFTYSSIPYLLLFRPVIFDLTKPFNIFIFSSYYALLSFCLIIFSSF